MNNFANKIKAKIYSKTNSSIFKDTFWALLFQGASAVIQVIYFIMVARYLGAEGYGTFEGIKAFSAIIFPFIGLGMNDLMIQYTSRDESKFSQNWGDTLLVFIFSLGIVLLVFFPLIKSLLPPISSLLILLLLLADLVGLKLCNLAGSAFISVHKVKQASQFGIIYVLCKLVAVMFLPVFPIEQRLFAWGFLYFLGSIVPAIVLLILVQKYIGRPRFNIRSFDFSKLKQGIFFAISESSSSINSQVDRTMLVSMSTPKAVGIYGAGYRFIDIGLLPIFAAMGANYARFFKYGESGIKGTLSFARKLLPFACLYGIFAAIALILFSPFATKILGEEFTQSSSVIVWFSPIPLLILLQSLAADTLTGAGFQRFRSFVQVGTAALNVGLNFYLIPLYSWHGAIWATLSSEIFKLVILWVIVIFLYRKITMTRSDKVEI